MLWLEVGVWLKYGLDCFLSIGCGTQIKMSERKSLMSWANLDHSVGFSFELYDSNSRALCKVKEESVSLIRPQDESNPYSVPFNIDQTVNFADLERNYRVRTDLSQLPSDRPFPNTLHETFQDQLARKGLKYLASLLLSTLRRKKFSSHREVAEEIQSQLLLRQCHESYPNDLSKEEKNIKRRIYDALNVMISAGVLEMEKSSRNYAVVNRKKRTTDLLQTISTRVEAKKELMAQLEAKRNALKCWIQRKQKRDSEEGHSLPFPLIVLINRKQEGLILEGAMDRIAIRHSNWEIYSQTDLIESIGSGEKEEATAIKKEEFLDEITYI